MATPTIQIDGATSGVGIPGASRDDLVTGELITLTDPANGVGPSYLWELYSKPPGSAAVLAGAATDTATFTLDVAGTYLIRVTVGGTDLSFTTNAIGETISTQGGAAAKLPNGLRVPGGLETTQFGVQGWSPALDTPWRNHDRNLPSDDEKDGLLNASPVPTAANPLVTEGGASVLTADQQAAFANASPLATGANPLVTEGFADLPSTMEKNALAGTSGTPDTGNEYVTDADPRNSDARTPLAHATSHEDGQSDELTVQNLGSGGASLDDVLLADGAGAWTLGQPLFGRDYQTALDVTTRINTGTGFDIVHTFVTSSLPVGDYMIMWYFVYSYNDAGTNIIHQLLANGTDQLNQGDSDVQIEPPDSGGGGPAGTDQRMTIGGHSIFTLGAPGTITLNLQQGATSGGIDKAMYHSRLTVFRVA